MVEYM